MFPLCAPRAPLCFMLFRDHESWSDLPIESIPDSRQHRYGRHSCQFRALKKTLNAEAAGTAEESTYSPRIRASA